VTTQEPTAEPLPAIPPVRFALSVAVVIVLVTVASYVTPTDFAATAVAVVFLAATHVFVLRHEAATIQAYGLSLGGLFEPERLQLKKMALSGVRALVIGLLCFAVIAGPFWAAYRAYFKLKRPFSWQAAAPGIDEILGQLFVIALPEEAFFRGYVQTQMDRWFPRRFTIASLPIGPSIVLTSLVFAVCHLLTVPNPARLAVFFPSLLFGALRAREGGVGAAVVFHAACNLMTAALARGYGPY
jgi:membrane protease YdiL (CAAX protease family)